MDNPSLSDEITRYISDRANTKLEPLDKALAQARKTITDPIALMTFELVQQPKRQKILEKFTPANWLTDAANRANQIQIVTHALKYTHTDARGSSIYDVGITTDSQNTLECGYLSTASLTTPILDTVGNAAVLDVAGLLQLKDNNGRSLLDYIRAANLTPLQPFTTSIEQLEQWGQGFKQVLTSEKLASHTLAKQLFFPIDDEGGYHLLLPLFPSSLVHAITQHITEHRYGEVAKTTRQAKKAGQYINGIVTHYQGLAIQKFGGSKPQNVSKLNAERRGQSYLFSCAPPYWNTKHTSPPRGQCIFEGGYYHLVKKPLLQLQNYLQRIAKKTSTKPRRDRREAEIENLFSLLIEYTTHLQAKLPAGWSAQSRLPEIQQLWLDPNRQHHDPVFKQKRQQSNWQKQISENFAYWLKKKIENENKGIRLADSEHEYLLKKAALLQQDLALQTEMEATV